MTQIVTVQQLIPFAPPAAAPASRHAATLGGAVYEFEPSEEEILDRAAAEEPGGADLSRRCSKTRPASRARA